MNLLDVGRRKQAPDDNSPLELTDPIEQTDFMNMRKLKPTEALTESRSTAEYERGIDNLIRGLVDLLPKPGSNWPYEGRAKWFRLAAGIFDLGYKSGDGKDTEISIAFVNHGAAKPAHDLMAPKNGQSN